MPAYNLKCQVCDNKEEHNMTIMEYCNSNLTCSKCNGKLVRDWTVKTDVVVNDQTTTRKGKGTVK